MYPGDGHQPADQNRTQLQPEEDQKVVAVALADGGANPGAVVVVALRGGGWAGPVGPVGAGGFKGWADAWRL